MSLKKLFDNGYLKKAEPTARDINAKFAVADRNLRDAANEDISIDTSVQAFIRSHACSCSGTTTGERLQTSVSKQPLLFHRES